MVTKPVQAHKIKRYGWVPDLPDHRDHLFTLSEKVVTPPAVDLRPKITFAPYDQGDLGSCTANAIAAAVQFDRIKLKLTPDFIPSRLFIYYNERLIEGTINEDSGAMLRDGIKSIANWGAPPETEWPYDISRFAVKPTAPVYGDAAKHRGIGYSRVRQTTADMRNCLAAGFPFVVGFSVYESFESDQVAKTGVVPMPATSEQLLGGHAVLAIGYDDSAKRFILRNSWGTNWGLQGYFTLPYDYLTNNNLSDDFWVVRLVSS